VTSSWFFLSTLNYDARSITHQIYIVTYSLRGKRLQQKTLKTVHAASDQKVISPIHLKLSKENIVFVGVKSPGGLAYWKE